jgi:hypothetical protein
LTPQQYSNSLRTATTDPATWQKLKSIDEIASKARGLASGAREWAKAFAAPSDDFQVGVTESLLLANDPKVQSDLLSDADGRLVGGLKSLDDAGEIVEIAFETVLNRRPDDEEQKLFVDYLDERRDRKIEAIRQIVWSLLTGSEFRFNY